MTYELDDTKALERELNVKTRLAEQLYTRMKHLEQEVRLQRHRAETWKSVTICETVMVAFVILMAWIWAAR